MGARACVCADEKAWRLTRCERGAGSMRPGGPRLYRTKCQVVERYVLRGEQPDLQGLGPRVKSVRGCKGGPEDDVRLQPQELTTQVTQAGSRVDCFPSVGCRFTKC